MVPTLSLSQRILIFNSIHKLRSKSLYSRLGIMLFALHSIILIRMPDHTKELMSLAFVHHRHPRGEHMMCVPGPFKMNEHIARSYIRATFIISCLYLGIR
ncbi:uncharacterized protein BT62DRAFT_178775 [Guyanagaster necrorhizus]|uniref:Uncharacterized protein n=1 Tax=Guyanagaster necrorhizus TaxID=856835 RepID=A0A9P7VTR1_9AGAR|nr:uncharacterized protein BT62DRAFT_178775 [Guyanagaster necrorhizus MCA 3950]KAG7445766.1 hypothetical protein BT62DRAFT_178775 [Guyanagaster necrorhizus MCA 3950]